MSEAPLTARLIVGVIIRDEQGRFLLLREEDGDGIKHLHLPGGHVEPGETILDAAVREAKEETGFDVKLGALVALRMNTWERAHSVKFVFHADVIGGDYKTETDAKGVWMTEEEVENTPVEEWNSGIKDILKLAMQGVTIDVKTLLWFDRR